MGAPKKVAAASVVTQLLQGQIAFKLKGIPSGENPSREKKSPQDINLRVKMENFGVRKKNWVGFFGAHL